jgi:hypothetical protein
MIHSEHNLSCGKIDNFFDTKTVAGFADVFRKMDTTDGKGNNCYGIDQQHRAYMWVKKQLLNPIAEHFDPNLKLIFSMLLDCVKPFPIHYDIKYIPEPGGQHYLSFLIPYSVDNNPALCANASTIIFNQAYNADDAVDVLKPSAPVANNVSGMYEKINHVPLESTYQYTLKQELVWSPGDLCWWDSKLCHVSNNFLQYGHTSKQAIVIHTYVL